MAGETNVARDLYVVPDFQNADEHYRIIRDEAGALAAGLTDTQFNWRSSPEKWSIAQCLDHLNVVGFLLLPRLEEAVDRARALGRRSDKPVNYGWMGRWFIRGVAPIPARKMKTPGAYNPSSTWAAVDEVLPRFKELQDRLINLAEDAQGYDVGHIKIASPVSGLLRLNIPAWLVATAAHEQRHLLQARAVREAVGFPEA
jgi:hypothetical protein